MFNRILKFENLKLMPAIENNSDDNIQITPTEFEQLVLEHMKGLGKDLTNFEAKHDVQLSAYDGTYQIDVKVTFEVLNCDFVILIECKRHSNPIKRETVQILHDKIRSTGAHKGIIFSTSDFQSGAEDYARAHGIALIRVRDGGYNYVTKGAGDKPQELPSWIDFPKYIGEFQPKRSTFCFLQTGYYDCLKEFLFPEEDHESA